MAPLPGTSETAWEAIQSTNDGQASGPLSSISADETYGGNKPASGCPSPFALKRALSSVAVAEAFAEFNSDASGATRNDAALETRANSPR